MIAISSILDPIFSAVMLVVFGISALVALMVFNSLVPTGIFGTLSGSFALFFVAINNVSIFIVLAMSLGAVVSAYLIKTNPIFFFVSVVLLFVMFLVVPTVILAFNGVASDSNFTSAASGLNLLIFMIERLPVITLVMSVLAALLGILRS